MVDEGLAGMISVGNSCRTLMRTWEPIMSRRVSFVIPRKWRYYEKLGSATLVGHQRKLTPNWETFLAHIGKCEAVQSRTMTLKGLYVFFVVVWAVCGLILLDIISNP